jgi:hypothetical protein
VGLYEVCDFTRFGNGRLLAKAIAEDSHIAITDFELPVETNLKSWVAAFTNNGDTLDVIASCIEQYFSGSKDLYKDNPEDNSIMILTIMDVWVALNGIAIKESLIERIFSRDSFKLPPSLTPSSVVRL